MAWLRSINTMRRKEQKRGSPADLSETDAFFNFLRGVQKEKSRNDGQGSHVSLQNYMSSRV
jgi:hypothetical protein